MNKNVETVKEAYAAFGRGNIPGVLELVSPDAAWTIVGPSSVIPYAGDHKGTAEIGEYFAKLAAAEDVRKFEPHEFIADGDTVVVLGHYHAHVKSTGREYDYDWAQVFTIADGRITRFREYCDTAAQMAAFRQ